jgi:hypothetical protein
MDDRFDDLSRALASPLPRRRFVTLMGAMVGAAAAGIGLRPQSAYANHCANTQKVSCKGGKCIISGTEQASSACGGCAGQPDGSPCSELNPPHVR